MAPQAASGRHQAAGAPRTRAATPGRSLETFAQRVLERARQRRRRIAFPEGDDPRVVRAAAELERCGAAEPVLLGAEDGAGGAGVGGGDGGSDLSDRRDAAGSQGPPADPEAAPGLVRAARMLRRGEVDGVVAGAVHTTADVVRAGLRQVGLAPGASTLSSSFFIEVADFRGCGAEVLSFADAAVVPDPSPARLAGIAREAVSLRRLVVGDEPRVAFLSYSTLGSAGGRSAARSREAARLFGAAFPDVAADGELQGDAALVPEVARSKAPGSPAAGRANVLVFPDLASANIAYKLVERLAGATALGPILQGLRAPWNDLSRGASASDVVSVAAITALMAE